MARSRYYWRAVDAGNPERVSGLRTRPLPLRACAGALLLLLATEPTGAQTPPPPDREQAIRTVFSTSRRFVISGFPPAIAADLARWTEDVAQRLEELLGPCPWERGGYVELEAGPGNQVARAQGWVDEVLQQRLTLGRGAELDQEDALEGLVWLILNRWPIQRQAMADRARELATVPDWLAVGVAQNLYAELRARNASTIQARWREDRLTAWVVLVEGEFLPAGRWATKAEAGQFVAWLLERRARLDALWDTSARGHRMNADEVARAVLDFPDRAEATTAWEVWLAAQQDRKRVVSGVDLEQVAEFDTWARIEDPDLQAVRANAQAPLMLADLIALRRTTWVPALASRRSWQIQMAMMGRGAEWQAVAQLYVHFLEALAGRGKGYSGGFFGRGASSRQLQALLVEADAARDRLRREIEARTAFLDTMEAGPQESLVDAEDHRYLDEMERKLAEESP
jgi:hypothetical protein